MAYRLYLGGVQFPIPPSKFTTKINNLNKTYELINDSQVNVLRSAGLTDFEFEVLLPNNPYSFAEYGRRNFVNADYYLERLEFLKANRVPSVLLLTRSRPNGELIYDTSVMVSIEDYAITEDAENGNDIDVSIKCRKFVDYGTKIVKKPKKTPSGATNKPNENSKKGKIVKPKPKRTPEKPSSPAPAPQQQSTYTVQSGDCLWNIAKQLYGDGSKYTELVAANPSITNPDLIYPNQVLTLP